MRSRINRPHRGSVLAAALSATGLGAFAWIHGREPFNGARVLGIAMGLGYAIAIAAMLRRATRWPQERRGWLLLCLGSLLAAVKTLLLTETPGHHLPIPDVRLASALLLTLGAASLTASGILVWPSCQRSGTGSRDRMLNGLGGLFLGASLWLLFWMGGTWHEGFQGHSTHHVHVLLLGFQMAVTAGAAGYLYLDCPRRGLGPIGLILVGQILVTALFGVISIWSGTGEHNPGFAMLAGQPLVLALAAAVASPVEQCVDAAHPDLHLPEIVPFVPFLLLGPVLALAVWREGGSVLWPAISLLAITGILIFRQVLLLRELRISNRELESRVEERTRILRELQVRQIRQERLNTLALMGAGMVHDLNNALGVVQASVDLARMDAAGLPPVLDGHLDRIHRATEQLAGLGQRIMAFARRGSEAPQPVDLVEEIRQVEPLLRMLVPRTVRLRVEAGGTLPAVIASRGLLEQVLVNLVANARDAMPRGGEIRVKAEVPEGLPATVLVTVSDTGQGIPPEIREHLFTPFVTTKAPGSGTGLGLASTKALMEEVGGSIRLDSGSGPGAAFVLAFPVPRAERAGGSCC